MRLLVVFGTRPEAIKLWPLVRLIKKTPGILLHTLCTRQHPELLDGLLPLLDWVPDTDLVEPPRRDMSERLSALLEGVQSAVEQMPFEPDAVLVQGDTFSTLAGAMVACYRKIPVIHLEAGLRTWDIGHPFPEEIHRQTLGRIATLHLAPTEQAQANLLKEGCKMDDVVVTGNTVVDALHMMRLKMHPPQGFSDSMHQDFGLVTLHRREHAGATALKIAEGLLEAQKQLALPFVVVGHPNSEVSGPFCSLLEAQEGFRVLPPVRYPEMLWLVNSARVVVTDSGGLQEEAAALGTPVGIVRRVTDRSEAVGVGCAKLLGIDAHAVFEGLVGMLSDVGTLASMAQARDVFGDGRASERALQAIIARFEG